MEQDNKKQDANVTKMAGKKGFRQAPKPTKGEVAKESQALSGQIMQTLNFLNQQVFGMLRRSGQLETEVGAMSELLGYRPSSEKAEVGDKLLVSYLGRLVNEDGTLGDTFEGGYSRLTVVGLGSAKFIPGFEDNLIGKETGQQAQFELTFPDNYPTHLKNKKVGFKVEVLKVYKALENLYSLEKEFTELMEAAKKKAEEAAREEKAEARANDPEALNE